MKSIISRLAFAVALFMNFNSASALAQTNPAAVDEALHNELRELKSDLEKAMNEGNIDSLLGRVEDGVVFTTMNNDVAVGKESIRQYFNKFMGSSGAPVNKITSTINADGMSVILDPEKKLALSYGKSDDRYSLKDGGFLALNARWTAVLSKRTGSWKVAAVHYSSDIFNNPLQDKMRQYWMMIAAACTVVSLAIGFFVGRRSAKA